MIKKSVVLIIYILLLYPVSFASAMNTDTTPPSSSVTHFTNTNEIDDKRECVLEDGLKKAYLDYDDVVGHGESRDLISVIIEVNTLLDKKSQELAICDDISCNDKDLSEKWHTITNPDLEEGWHNLSGRAKDSLNNGEEFKQSNMCMFCIDKKAPKKIANIVHSNPSECVPNFVNEAPRFGWSAVEDEGCAGIDFYEVEVYFSNGSIAYTTTTKNASIQIASPKNGQDYFIRARAVDKAGKEADWSEFSEKVFFDTGKPSVKINFPIKDSWFKNDFNVNETDTDPEGNLWKCFYKVRNNGEDTTEGGRIYTLETQCNGPLVIDISKYCAEDGTCEVFKRAQDKACNVNPTRDVSVNIDRTPPETTKTVGEPKFPGMQNTIEFSFSGLEKLSQGHYEGWAIFGDEKISTGKFNIGEPLIFSIGRELSNADAFAITIEPEGDSDDVPSGIVVLAGELNGGNMAQLSFPIDLSAVQGNYILATPTNDPSLDETSGVWFLKIIHSGAEKGLNIPTLPAGWKYEGWAVNQGKPLTTGKFISAEGADEFNGFSGNQSAPAFPGEDFLVNAPPNTTFPINLADGNSKIVVSIEPDLGGDDPTGPEPFSIKPLIANVLLNASHHTNFGMQQNLNSIPSGKATISDSIDWFITDKTEISLDCDDEGIGCNETFYRIDGGSLTKYTSSFSLKEDGIHIIEYFSVDEIGNTEEIKKETDKVDTEPPTSVKTEEPVFIDSGNKIWVSKNTLFTITASDSEVGVSTILYKIDKEAWNIYESPFTIENSCNGESSTHLIEYQSFDQLSNTEEIKNQTVILDCEAPGIAVLNPTPSEASNIEKCLQSTVAFVDDSGSGVKRVWAELWNSNNTKVREEEMTLTKTKTYEALMDKQLPPGKYILKIKAEDNSGNIAIQDIQEILPESVFVEFLSPAICAIDPEKGGSCNFTFNVCMRGGDSIKLWMNKLGGIVTPSMMKAAISKGQNSTFVGLMNETTPLTEAGLLDLGQGVINGKTTFDLALKLPSNISSQIGAGAHRLDYLIKSFK